MQHGVWFCERIFDVSACRSASPLQIRLFEICSIAHGRARLEILHTDVGALNGGLGRPEAQADVLVPSPATLADAVVPRLGDEVDVRLLLESALALDGKLGRHGCCGGLSRRGGWVVNEVVGVEKKVVGFRVRCYSNSRRCGWRARAFA